MKLDPFGESVIEDYRDVMRAFAIKEIPVELMPGDNFLFRRKIVFAHRDIERIIDAHRKGKEFAIMTGIKPSNNFHLGSKLVAEQIKYFQRLGAKLFYCIADLEALITNKIALEEQRDTAIDNIADLLALGVDASEKRAYFYRQSKQTRVNNMAFVFSNNVTNNMMRAIYGEKDIGYYMAALIQVADILLPQMPEFGGPKPTVVPVGIDQDPHIRLTRDIAPKHGLISPSSTYNKFIRSLSGDSKMSKRDESSMITLSDTEEDIERKVMNGFTGGRATVKEQKEKGGQPENCPIYELFLFHLEKDDKKLKERYEACKAGKLLCGDCKKEAIGRLKKMLMEHQRKKRKLMDKARSIVDSM
ncbi:tryptophan--tRNA ligase [Candidatus Micrarchaeota archaeon]|nr:MAG: tryptophan--tRNA ligase [Candidatus Micrarchaeota archaeon]